MAALADYSGFTNQGWNAIANSPVIPTCSYYAQTVDDTGHPSVQHKPLAKGLHAQPSLTKTFDDPGMRPKVFSPENVNKLHYSLMTRDIEGNVPRPKDVPERPRNTDPNAPMYTLPGTSSLHATSSITSSSRPSSARPTGAAAAPFATSSNAPAPNDKVHVRDINGPSSITEQPYAMNTRTWALNSTDVEGSWSGWKPHHRKHVGVNLRDPGLDVKDIDSYMPKRKPQPRSGPADIAAAAAGKTAVQEQRGVRERALYECNRLAMQQPPEIAAAAAAERSAAAAAQAAVVSSSGLHVVATDSSSAEAREDAQLHAASMRSSQSNSPAARLVAETVGKGALGKPVRYDASIRHNARVVLADERRAAESAAAAVLSQLPLGTLVGSTTHQSNVAQGSGSVEIFWSACKRLDREGCGKLQAHEFAVAARTAKLPLNTSQLQTLAEGVRDNAGFVDYRRLSTLMLAARSGMLRGQDAPQPTKPRPFSAAPGGASRSPASGAASSATSGAASSATSGAAVSRSISGGQGGAPLNAHRPAADDAPSPPPSLAQNTQHTRRQTMSACFAVGGTGRVPAQYDLNSSSGTLLGASTSGPSGQPRMHSDHNTPHPHHQQQQQRVSFDSQSSAPTSSTHSGSTPSGRSVSALMLPGAMPAIHPAPQQQWPPAEAPSQPQLRPRSAIEARVCAPTPGQSLALPPASGQRDPVTGSIYYPYKATPFWFGGNTSDQPSQLVEGAAQYRPSVDPAYSTAATRKPYIGDGGKIGDDVPTAAGVSRQVHGPGIGVSGAYGVGGAGSGVALGGSAGASLWAVSSGGSVLNTITAMKQRPGSAVQTSRSHAAAAGAHLGAAMHASFATGSGDGRSGSTPPSRPASAAARLHGASGAHMPAAGRSTWEVAGGSSRSGSVGRSAASFSSTSFTAALAQPAGPGSVRLERQMLRDEIASVRSLA